MILERREEVEAFPNVEYARVRTRIIIIEKVAETSRGMRIWALLHSSLPIPRSVDALFSNQRECVYRNKRRNFPSSESIVLRARRVKIELHAMRKSRLCELVPSVCMSPTPLSILKFYSKLA